ncbi:myosin-11-like [Euwallacea fornicatus]|uniref:myosin-11-like n=1 Tax=Euwallacea fornicatus TaxID=995702 RepID=UPI00338DE472
MALRDFCKSLYQCSEKLEAELRININDFNNFIHGKSVDETAIALERAKDYHFQEIFDAVEVILEKVKVVVFHQEKIDWLSDSRNFTANYLKRFSYVKNQIYNFTKPETITRSEENLSRKVKRERRRTVSEISVGSLESWEKYLDKKKENDDSAADVPIEVKKEVPKRTSANRRARKRFVSSTFGGFLDNETAHKPGLESIMEGVTPEMATDDVIQNILDQFLYQYHENAPLRDRLSYSCGNLTDDDREIGLDVRSKSNKNFINSAGEESKPKIVDVIANTMGLTSSKSPLERRNTIARRSQRRTLHNLKSKVENFHKEIKKFKGVTEDTNYVNLKREIESFKNDLSRRGKDLQPQIRNLYETVYKKVREVEEALQDKLQENREKLGKKEAKERENGVVSPSTVDDFSEVQGSALEDGQSFESNETVVEVHAEDETETKRKTVEINLLKIINEDEAKSPKEVRIVSPAEKRKSILKVGVPVMPGAVMNEFNLHTNKITLQPTNSSTPTSPIAPRTVQEVTNRIADMIESIRQIEHEISEFVGKKDGRQYRQIKDTLIKYLGELNTLSPVDDYALDQLIVCRTYISSCISFLDEKAVSDRPESFTSDDEVFDNNNVPPALKEVEKNFKLQRILKNTAV